ncbi:MAG: hypothetical protein GY906_35535 [bacterium]|nr:hypothetical protein [bacterium]
MGTNLDVEKALDEVVVGIETGAQPFKLDGKTRAMVREMYGKGFREQRSRSHVDWSKDSVTVLRLASKLGWYAAMMTSYVHAIKGQRAPDVLDSDAVWFAALWISGVDCGNPIPEGGAGVIRAQGGYCPPKYICLVRPEICQADIASSIGDRFELLAQALAARA